ncbi:hypothetical protein EDB87DRAFT_1556259 [Lactarius vividus]|nr:hypothetical protein EDB87DRAFT_1556259 [Lactarius vividus]
MDGTEFGRYGVLRFMRRHEDTVIASYPIDDDELTFGCDSSCSVRLYYPTVSPLHAKIFFQERKAFIEVLGVHGLFVDKCRIFPKTKPTTTIVPLSNNSELEINKKRFRFEYPPKALRPVLAFTPSASTSKSARKRILRLSMIQSAQVFTPRPDPDPRVNLRVLQTPIRLNSSPLKQAFKQEQDDQQDKEDGTPIRLVEGNRPQVVEEEQDLVILEEVDAPEASAPSQAAQHVRGPQAGAPHAAPGFPLAPSHQPQQFQTPRRRSARPSLHRAVLIRSAQRAAIRFEMEQEQELEEREVEEHVATIDEQMEVDEEDEGDQDAIIEEFDEEVYQEGAAEGTEPDSRPIFGWRKSLEAFRSSIHALRSPSRSPERDEDMEQDIAEVTELAHEDVEEYTAPDQDEPLDRDDEPQEPGDEEGLGDASHEGDAKPGSDFANRGSVTPQLTPQRPEQRLYFMTPQTHRPNGAPSLADRVRGRQSTGGAAWTSLAKPWTVAEDPATAVDKSAPQANAESRERRVSQLERRAIQERRRSALTQPDEFFGENIPGSRRNSLGPETPNSKAMLGVASPSKIWPAIKEDEEEVETAMLLEKMKEVVEGMQRRRSMQPEAPIFNKTEICDEDMALQDETPEGDEAIVEDQCPSQTDPHPVTHSFPATPQMSDLRHVFSEKRAAGMPTPYAGVRKLFQAEQARDPETPRLDGVREMFSRARQQEPSTPIFEGVDEMLVTPPEHPSQEPAGQSDEVDAPEVAAPAPTRLLRPASGATVKTLAVRMREGRETPTDMSELADNEQTPDAPPAKPSKHNANAPKASIVRRTTRRAEAEGKEAPAKSVSKARKVVTPEVSEPPAQPKPAASRLESGRRSRTATKSSGSTDQEPAESSKPTRKTARGTKAMIAPAPEPEPEPAKSIRRGARRGQPDVAPAAATIKRRAAKPKAGDGDDVDDLPEPVDRAEPSGTPLLAARTRRGKGKPAELEDGNAGAAGAQRTAQGRRTPTAAAAAATKVRAAAPSAKSARGTIEKENTPERIHVKEEDDVQQQLQPPAVVAKGVRTRKATTAAQRAHSETEKDADTAKRRRGRRERGPLVGGSKCERCAA